MSVSLVFFLLFSLLCVFSAFMVTASKNPIHSVLFLILSFFNASGLLILLNVEYLAMVFLMVYVGAIAVLFLFVVMMLNVRVIEYKESLIRYVPLGGLLAFIFLSEIYLVVKQDIHNVTVGSSVDYTSLLSWVDVVNSVSNISAVGSVLYTYYAYAFILAGLILLIAMMGAIVLTMYRRLDLKRQAIYSQVSRDFIAAVQNRR